MKKVLLLLVFLVFAVQASLSQENGLLATFYDNMFFQGDPVLERVEATLDFDAGSGSVDPLVPDDYATMMWRGQITPDYTETYYFILFHNDGARIWIDGELILDKWGDGKVTDSVEIDLVADQAFDIVVKIYEKSGTTQGQLSWKSASQASQVIPADHMKAVAVHIPLIGVSVYPETFKLFSNGLISGQLTANLLDANATNQNVTWESLNTEVATVDQNGMVTAIADGEAVVKVTTEEGSFTAQSIITVVVGATDASLASLVPGEGTLDPEFSSTTYSYSLELPANVSSLDLVATPSDPNANVEGDGEIDLSGGSSSVDVIVTAEDGVTTQTYTMDITVLPSDDARLKSIEVSAGSLDPGFASQQTTYSLVLEAGSTSVDITATPFDDKATVTGDGTISVNSDGATATIIVTAEDGETRKTYTINISISGVGTEHLTGNVISVYPNPANEILMVEGAVAGSCYVLIDIAGQVVKQGLLKGEMNMLNIEELCSGLYIIKLADGGKNSYTRILKQ